jgi:hypothetical protein
MPPTLSLRAALKQGALVTVANWPVVLVEFALWALFELALGVPILGGALMVAVLLGFDLDGLLAQGLGNTADLIMASLVAAPVALGAFLIAVGLVAAGGLMLVFMVKAGTLAVLAAGERAATDLHRAPIHVAGLQQASAWSLSAMFAGVQRYGGRGARLAMVLSATYLVIVALAFGSIALGFRLAGNTAWASAWVVLVGLATSAGVIAGTTANLLFDLARIIIVTDDCGVRDALRRAWRFVVRDARHVIGIFAVTSAIVFLAAAAWIVATANIAFIGLVPVVGLLVAPLQAAIWIVRGLVFQYLALATLTAYQTQYRRFREPGAAPATPIRSQFAGRITSRSSPAPAAT